MTMATEGKKKRKATPAQLKALAKGRRVRKANLKAQGKGKSKPTKKAKGAKRKGKGRKGKKNCKCHKVEVKLPAAKGRKAGTYKGTVCLIGF
jgi:hypothetical protein